MCGVCPLTAGSRTPSRAAVGDAGVGVVELAPRRAGRLGAAVGHGRRLDDERDAAGAVLQREAVLREDFGGDLPRRSSSRLRLHDERRRHERAAQDDLQARGLQLRQHVEDAAAPIRSGLVAAHTRGQRRGDGDGEGETETGDDASDRHPPDSTSHDSVHHVPFRLLRLSPVSIRGRR
jgi:hypothetical protein